MLSGLMIIVAIVLFVALLFAFSNLKIRVVSLELQVRSLQKRLEQLLSGLNESTDAKLSASANLVRPAVNVDATTSTDINKNRANPSAPSPTVTPGSTSSLSTSRFIPATPEQQLQKQHKPVMIRDENSIGARLMHKLINSNPIAKVAIIILFFGIAYLLKYSIDHGLLSPEIRIMGSLLLGLTLLTCGWKLRNKSALYAVILQGGAIGVLYLTLFAAFKLYDLVPLILTFILLVVVCATSIVFAVLQRAISLAIVACVGGYLAPILLSSGTGNHIALFSYYLLISTAILVISCWQSWRVLNLIGFIFTFVVAAVWGARSFQAQFYVECQFFILANMLIYGILAVVLSIRNQEKDPYQQLFDLILLFSVPLTAFSLQYAITAHWEFAPAFSALGFGLFYLIGSMTVLRIWQGRAKQLALYGLAIGLGFSTLAVPLALSANWTALVWLFEGTAITYIALSQRQYRFGWIGAIVVLLGTLSAIMANQLRYIDNSAFITLYGIVSGLLLLNGCLWHHYRRLNESADIIKLLFLITAASAWSLWIICSTYRLFEHVDYIAQPLIACFVIAVWLWFAIGRKVNWPLLRYAVIALWPVLLLSLIYNQLFYIHSYHSAGWTLSWLAAFVSGYCYLYFDQHHLARHKSLIVVLHVSLLWLILGWLFTETYWLLSWLPWEFEAVQWSVLSLVAGLIILGCYILQKYRAFPLGNFSHLYWTIGLLPLGLYLIGHLLLGLCDSGQIIYWTYIPLINPLELSAIFALLMLSLWLHEGIKAIIKRCAYPIHSLYPTIFMIAMLFLWGNSIILRMLSQWYDISWSFYALWHNNIVQMVLSLVWTLAAVVLVVIAHRYSIRNTWFAGFILQVIVIVKLIFIDSTELDGLMRAFAFIGVALLMLVIGYFAPLPPKMQQISTDKQNDNRHI